MFYKNHNIYSFSVYLDKTNIFTYLNTKVKREMTQLAQVFIILF